MRENLQLTEPIVGLTHLPYSDQDPELRAFPNFVIYKHEVTDGYLYCDQGQRIVQHLGRIWDVYLVDVATAVHICSMTGTYEGRFLYTYHEKGRDDSGLNEYDYERMVDELITDGRPDNEYDYFSMGAVDGALKRGEAKVADVDESEETYYDIREATFEHEIGNPTFC